MSKELLLVNKKCNSLIEIIYFKMCFPKEQIKKSSKATIVKLDWRFLKCSQYLCMFVVLKSLGASSCQWEPFLGDHSMKTEII